MKCFKAYIFDLDDTLVDYTSANRIAYSVLCKKIRDDLMKIGQSNVPTQGELKQKIRSANVLTKNQTGRSPSCHNRVLYFSKVAKQLGFIRPYVKAIEWWEVYEKAYIDNMRVFPWVKPLLERLKVEGYYLGICTNQIALLQYKILEKTGLDYYFDRVVTSEEVGVEKPDFKIYDAVWPSIPKLKHNQVCFIGDDKKCDFEGPRKFGFSSIKYEDFVSEVINEYSGRKIWEMSEVR